MKTLLLSDHLVKNNLWYCKYNKRRYYKWQNMQYKLHNRRKDERKQKLIYKKM